MKKVSVGFVMCMFVVLSVPMAAMAAGGGGGGGTPGIVPTELPMVISTKALMSYAKEQVAEAAAYAGSEGTILPGGRTWAQVYAQDPDIRVIQELLAKETLSFSILDPESNQYFFAYLMDSVGYMLFYGESCFKLEDDGLGNWQVPAGAGDITMKMAAEVPIYIPGVDYAYVLVTDPVTGEQRYVYLNVWNDRVFFSVSLAGIPGGQIVVSIGDGFGVYDITTGETATTTPVNSSVNVGIKGLITLDDPTQVISNPESIAGKGENPLYQITVSSTEYVDLYGKTTEGGCYWRID